MSLKTRICRLEAQSPRSEADPALTERLRRAHVRLGLAPFEGWAHRFHGLCPSRRIQMAENNQKEVNHA